MAVTPFHKDDSGFRRWRKSHSGGFVFNTLGGSDAGDNVLHRADCDHLVPKPSQQWTSVKKLCSTDRAELEVAAEAERKGRPWTKCDRCAP